MPRRYRKRAYRRRGGLKITKTPQKQATPIARFNFNDNYLVQMPAAAPYPTPGALLQINVATPFESLDTGAATTKGTWVSQNGVAASQPHGIDSDIYSQYRHLIVLAARVKVNVRDAVDLQPVLPSANTLLEGTVNLVRTSDTGIINDTDTSTSLRDYYQSKQKRFVMAANGINNKTYNCTISMGYSAAKTFYSNPVSNQDLWVVNTAGSSNTPTDSTYITILIRPSEDTISNKTLKDFNVNVSISYLIRFIEPNAAVNIPMPLPKANKYVKKSYSNLSSKASYAAGLASLLGSLALSGGVSASRRAALAALNGEPHGYGRWIGGHPFMRW